MRAARRSPRRPSGGFAVLKHCFAAIAAGALLAVAVGAQADVPPQVTYAGKTYTCTLVGTAGKDFLVGTARRDSFFAFDAYADRLDGGPGYDDGWADQRDSYRSVEGLK